MDFDSHVNGTALAAVELVNAVTPGMRGGREVLVPTTADARRALVADLLAEHRRGSVEPTDADVGALTDWAGRLREVIASVDGGDLDGACERLNAVLAASGAVPTLTRHDGEHWHLHFHRADAPLHEAWASAMATGLAVVLGHPPVERLGICRAPECDRVYADTSRNNTRRFCSTTCQNRVKAAAYRSRRAGG